MDLKYVDKVEQLEIDNNKQLQADLKKAFEDIDANCDFLQDIVETNNLHDNDILLLPAGTEVVVFV